MCCSLQPGGVQSEHLPHLSGADPNSEPDPVLRLQRRVGDLLEFSGRVGNRALPNAATVHFFLTLSSSVLVDLFGRSPRLCVQVLRSRLLHRSGPSGGDHGQYRLWKAGGHKLCCSGTAGVGSAADRGTGFSHAPTDQTDGAHLTPSPPTARSYFFTFPDSLPSAFDLSAASCGSRLMGV